VFPSSKFSRIALAVTLLLAALLFLAVLAVRTPAESHQASELVQSLIVSWAAVCAFVAARRSSGYSRQLWGLLAAALALATTGHLLVFYFGSIQGAARSSPWPSDILLFIWVAPAAMMLLPWRLERSSLARWERVLDFAQIGIVFVTAYLYFFYIPALWESQGPLMFRRLMAAAVARDALLAAGFFLRSVTFPRSPVRSFFARISAFFVFLGVVEAVAISGLSKTLHVSDWADASWALPFLFAAILAATWSTPSQPQREPEAFSHQVWVVSQALPVAIPLLVILMGSSIAHEQITIAALAVAFAFLCSSARLLLTSRRHQRTVLDLRRAEHAAGLSEQLFSAAFRFSPDAISISLIPEGAILEINDSFMRLTGLSRDEVIGKSPQGLGLWVDDDKMRALQARFREVGEIRDVELRFRRKDGSLRDGRFSGSIITLDGRRYSLVVVTDVTESKQAADALRASEERFRSLVQTLRVAVLSWGPDGRLQFVNQALLDMFGITREQILGRSGQDILPAIREDGTRLPEEMRPVQRAIATRLPVRNQVMGWPIPGTDRIVWTLTDAVPEISPEGQLVRVISSLTNVSDWKRAEQEKRVSEEMFSKAFQSSPDAMTISTLHDGRYLEVNEGYLHLFGWRREEVIGKTTTELGIWPDPSEREILKRRLLDEGRVRQMELHLRVKSGRVRTFQVSADVIELNGRACMLAVSDDVTDWKEAQEALRFSEARFRTLVQSLDVGVALFSADGRLQFANPAALRMARVSFEDAFGKLPSEMPMRITREDGSPVTGSLRPVEQVIKSGQPVRDIVQGWQVAGSEEIVWIYGNVVPLISEDGKVAGVVASFSNITEQKKSEEVLRQLSGRLLRLQDEERRRLGRDLHDSLAQSVLAVNLSLAQITKSAKELDERSTRALSEARFMLQQMSREIRTLSYLLHPPLLDELGLASAVKEYAHGLGERSGIHIQVGVSPGFGRLPQDTETALFRVIQESLANIQRHSGSSTARILLDRRPDCILLEICDEGTGIPEATAQIANEAAARFGVGIAGMRERMAQLGGTLVIESGASGTTVRATLPVKAEVLDVAAHSRGG